MMQHQQFLSTSNRDLVSACFFIRPTFWHFFEDDGATTTYRIKNDDDDNEEEEDGSIRETRALAGLETQTSLEC
jgi:hypothetical protein